MNPENKQNDQKLDLSDDVKQSQNTTDSIEAPQQNSQPANPQSDNAEHTEKALMSEKHAKPPLTKEEAISIATIEQLRQRQKEIEEEKQRLIESRPKKLLKVLWIILNILFLGIPALFSLINRKLHLKITIKTSLLFCIMFIVIITTFVSFLVVSMDSFLYTNVYDKMSEYFTGATFYDEQNIDYLIYDALLVDQNGDVIATNIQADGLNERLLEYKDVEKYIVEGSRIYAAKTKIIAQEGAPDKTITLILSLSISAEQRFMNNLKITIAILAPLFLVLCFGLGTVASQGMLSPIRKMTDTLKGITPKKLSTRLEPIDSQDELRELTDIVNGMLNTLEDSFNQQTAFVGNASHELRTPIAVIQGYSNLLNRWGKTDPAILQESLEAIAKESHNMKNLVEKLLFLTKLGNRYTLNYETFSLSDMVDEQLKEMRMIDTKHSYNAGKIKPTEIEGDRELIKQVLRIFTDNAKKYTPENRDIELSCFSKGGNINLIIKDSGIGISEEDLPYIFERFFRCDKARSRSEGSTGLGLSIARQIIELHGGEITVSSKLGEGTRFLIELPPVQGQLLFEVD